MSGVVEVMPGYLLAAHKSRKWHNWITTSIVAVTVDVLSSTIYQRVNLFDLSSADAQLGLGQ